jgi:hypothetical protein
MTILALVLRERIALALAIGCWLWLAYIQWGGHFLLGEPVAKYIRYFSMIVPIQCLVLGAIWGRLFKFSKKLKPAVILLFAFLVIHLAWMGTRAVNAVKIHTKDFKEITRFLMNLQLDEDDTVYTDDLTGNFIKLYSKGEMNIRRLNFKDTAFPERGILVVNGSWYAVELPDYRNSMPQWSLNPPSNWRLLYTVRGNDVGIYGKFNPQIYRILP